MNRRHFTKLTAGAALAAPAGLLAAEENPQPHLLSTEGCGRATGYAEANKIITIGDRTHVAWLDSPPEGFRVRLATLDRRTGKWSRTHTVGKAYDNHGGPALTCDSEGYLHITYHPHHHAFRYRRSKRPNDASAWGDEILFGERLTYPTLICGRDDTLYFTARRSDANPWWVELWEKKPNADWTRVGPVIHSRDKGYAHFQESLCWGPDHQTIHLACRIHEASDKSAYGRKQTVAYLKTEDFGRTWLRADGTPIKGPITVDNIDVLARGGVDVDRGLRSGSVAVGPDGVPRVMYSVVEPGNVDTIIATSDGQGGWQRRSLKRELNKAWKGYTMRTPGVVAFDQTGVLHGVAQLQTVAREKTIWGDPTNEVAGFTISGPDSSVGFHAVSRFDSQASHWLPNIERPTGHNLVPVKPGVIYTGGSPGSKNTELVRNKVYWGT